MTLEGGEKSSNTDTSGFIYVPSRNLYVAKKRSLLNKDWVVCHKELQKNNQRMPTLSEFIEFLKHLISNSNNEEYQAIYKDLTEAKVPWRAEWLDADFKFENKKLYINYNHVLNKNGNLIPKNLELLDSNTLMRDKTPGIDLEDYIIKNHTEQGLPNKKVKPGFFYYWHPSKDNLSVARFGTGSDRVVLNCGRYKFGSYPNLGVYACKDA
ncbi:MAG: hypothetical protein AABX44_00460 [Nanoarchaeota archaeon]